MTDITNSFELDQIEKRLKNILAPVEPDPGFVQRLKEKLKRKTEIYLEKKEPVFYFLVVILGVIVAILAYFIAIRKKE
jgi:hypothetical protein